MGRKCPMGGYVLYLDCLECEEKVCKGSGNLQLTKEQKRQIYRDKVDTIMSNYGYYLFVVKNLHEENEIRYYRNKFLSNSDDRVVIEVRKRKEFRFSYTNIQMCAFLHTDWMSPIDNEEHLTKMLKKFRRSVWSLRQEWNDW